MTQVSNQWSSQLAFIWVTSGAAVGLGNIWLFSYMAGANGGSAFVLVFLLCVALIGIPAMISEVLAGTLAKQNPISGLNALASQYRGHGLWPLLGWMGALALLMILAFYSVVAGWALGYLSYAITGTFNHTDKGSILSLWDHFIASPSLLLLWHSLFMFLTLGIVAKGIQEGIERASKIMMPGLFIILIYLVAYAAFHGNFSDGFHFLFSFDIEKITPKVILVAMGQAFFSLAVGAGCMFVYGAYLPPNSNFVGALCWTAVLNTLVALLAGLAIFPLVFAQGLAPTSGPGLMFQALPIAFSQMPGGQWIAISFFTLLIFAALTSTFSLAEPLVMILIEKLNLSRKIASLVVGLVAWALGITALLSFNIWKELTLFNRYTFFDILTGIPVNIMIPLGGLGFACLAVWMLPQTVSKERIHLSPRCYQIWYIITRYVTPIGITTVFIYGLIS
ncbi:MAG: sodium-dependent transporter [Gammaproteobacteria bacterium]